MFILDGSELKSFLLIARKLFDIKGLEQLNIMPKISFIIASVDRDRQLEECICSIGKAHEYSPDIPIEILVVIQKVKEKKDIRIRYPEITHFYHTDKIGLSAARNFAIGKSAGEYLVFLDDDAGVSENFINVLSEKIIKYNKIGVFCGRLIDPVRNIPFSVIFSDKRLKKLRHFEYQYFMGSAHVLSRRVIERIGCYDERFGAGAKYYGSEETDVFFRSKAAGEQIVYLPDLVFFHPVLFPPPDYSYRYSYAFGAMLMKNWISDKAYFFVYCAIFLRTIFSSLLRIFQKMFLIFARKKERREAYRHYLILRGILSGVVNFIRCEM